MDTIAEDTLNALIKEACDEFRAGRIDERQLVDAAVQAHVRIYGRDATFTTNHDQGDCDCDECREARGRR